MRLQEKPCVQQISQMYNPFHLNLCYLYTAIPYLHLNIINVEMDAGVPTPLLSNYIEQPRYERNHVMGSYVKLWARWRHIAIDRTRQEVR